MHHVNLFAAAAMVLFGSSVALSAEPAVASNSTEVSTSGPGASPVTAPADVAAAPAAVPPSPVVETAVLQGMKDPPQVAQTGPIRPAAHAIVAQHRPVTHRARHACVPPHHPARMARRAMAPRFAPTRAFLSLVASNYVVLGAGY